MLIRINRVVAFAAPIAVAVMLSAIMPQSTTQQIDERLQLRYVQVNSAAELSKTFADMGYNWPMVEGDTVPSIVVRQLPNDMADVSDVKEKKALFFRALLPIVLAENDIVLHLRETAIALLDKGVARLSASERRWLETIASHHKVTAAIETDEFRRILLRRVDIVPPALALAQAANESAWGTSRFSRLGNNLFGQWTYRQSEGIVPLGRPDGATYAVRAFSSVDASVRAYIFNINTNAAYKHLRVLRQQMRDAGQSPNAYHMAAGLEAYSARGEAYIEELRVMMRGNKLLTMLEGITLSGS